MSTFLRLLHLSDLHFGDRFYSTRGLIQGYEKHDASVAVGLSDCLRTLALRNDSPNDLVVTGDLTASGRLSSLSLVNTYLRGRIFIGTRAWAGLQRPNTPVVPGNHDIWSGVISGIGGAAGTPPSSRPEFDQFFNPPAPGPRTIYPRGMTFPYQLRVCAGPPAVYLYGLDCTRADLLPLPQWANLLADGFVDKPQLDALRDLVATERNEDRVRLAALHHAPMVGSRMGGGVVNFDAEVLPTLQNLGFSVLLGGHHHRGFVSELPGVNPRVSSLHVAAVGTATQAVHLSSSEQRLLARRVNGMNGFERRQWHAAVEKCNEFRVYDFSIQPSTPRELNISIRVFTYFPNLSAFVFRSGPSLPPIRF